MSAQNATVGFLFADPFVACPRGFVASYKGISKKKAYSRILRTHFVKYLHSF